MVSRKHTTVIVCFSFFLAGCSRNTGNYVHDGDVVYANAARNVKYVGSRRCAACHQEIFESYSTSEMGRSMSLPDTAGASGEFPLQEVVTDSASNFSYEMVMHDGHLYQREIRQTAGGKIVHDRSMRVDYVIGSGNNLRMFFHDENGMLYELPLTWYVHRKKWDLSPGYRDFGNLRFRRYAEPKCISCHNSYLEESTTANDRYVKPFPLGIGCERCHGPGELHVRQKTGETLPALPEGARTIVNPRTLTSQRQLDVCRQCHLQGKAWALCGDKRDFDFRPGMLLEEYSSVYSEQANRKETFEVADSPHRLSLSRCFKESGGRLTCITCHDPHRSIRTFSIEHYIGKCLACHPAKTLPVGNTPFRHTAESNCISCHMNRTGLDNTLHGVSNTDHWIRVDANQTVIDWSSLRQPQDKRALTCLVADVDLRDNGSMLRRGLAYLQYYQEQDNRRAYLDSASMYISRGLQLEENSAPGYFSLGLVRMKNQRYDEAIACFQRALALRPAYPQASFGLGEASMAKGGAGTAIGHYKHALQLKPDEPTYLEGLAVALSASGNHVEAIRHLRGAIARDSQSPAPYHELAMIYATRLNRPDSALPCFLEVVRLDPDFPDCYLDLGNTYGLLGDFAHALDAYRHESASHPRSTSVLVNMAHVYALMGRKNEARDAIKRAMKMDPAMALPEGVLKEIRP